MPVVRWTRTVAPGQSFQLIEWDGHELLIGCSQGGHGVLRTRPIRSGEKLEREAAQARGS